MGIIKNWKHRMSSSKLTNAAVLEGVTNLRAAMKPRKFRETVELQIGLKDYDPQKDKRFVGSVRLPNVPRPTLKICLIADAKHQAEAEKAGLDIDIKSLDELKTFNKDKKLVKKWAKQYALLLASDTVLKRCPSSLDPSSPESRDSLPSSPTRSPSKPRSWTPVLPLSSSLRRSAAWPPPSVTSR